MMSWKQSLLTWIVVIVVDVIDDVVDVDAVIVVDDIYDVDNVVVDANKMIVLGRVEWTTEMRNI